MIREPCCDQGFGMACAAVLEELSGTQEYLQQVHSAECVGQMAEVWVQKLESLDLSTSAQASGFIEVIKKGPWSQAQKDSLMVAVNSALLASHGGRHQRRQLQQVKDFSNYMSKRDLEVLGDPRAGLACKLDQVVTRLVRLGIETSLRVVLSAAIHGGLVCGDRSHTCVSLSLLILWSFDTLRFVCCWILFVGFFSDDVEINSNLKKIPSRRPRVRQEP